MERRGGWDELARASWEEVRQLPSPMDERREEMGRGNVAMACRRAAVSETSEMVLPSLGRMVVELASWRVCSITSVKEEREVWRMVRSASVSWDFRWSVRESRR